MFNFRRLAWLLLMLFVLGGALYAMQATESAPDKKLDLLKWHDVGNIWLRVSNYGFFGSGDDVIPRYPSLEYPGGSGIDYLYQGSLWFGAKKYRRNAAGRLLYWNHMPPEDADDYLDENDPDCIFLYPVIDTLVTVGFDGDSDLYEFLPAYNPLEQSAMGQTYQMYNLRDTVLYSSTRRQRAGTDDDGDGRIDEDPPGQAFPLRPGDELPQALDEAGFGGQYLHMIEPDIQYSTIQYVNEELGIWFPLGFVDLGIVESETWIFSEPCDDDTDGLFDEDGYPVSEQDYISYYYDYSPFDTPGQRDWGGSRTRNTHVPLNIMVRQMSYQWSYDYIKNLVYVEFDITNKNDIDDLYDCAMGVYMDSDVGPQSWGADEVSLDDISSYVSGEGFEFAYTYDADTDQGLTTGYVGSRVCTPDPDQLEFACWTWERGDGPDDEDPLDVSPTGTITANEKYYLLTDRNPDNSKFTSLRDFPDTQLNDPCDTRYLFAFYGDMQGIDNPSETSWNLEPGATMKIVIAIFPGESVEELKQTAEWAKEIYGDAQVLENVVMPDIFPHYTPPEPPTVPNAAYFPSADGRSFRFVWDNRSEFFYDYQTVSNGSIGYQDSIPVLPSYDPNVHEGDEGYNINAILDPTSAHILRHDFQGYRIWHRIGSGSYEAWMSLESWDKVDTQTDLWHYDIVKDLFEANYLDYGGELGRDTGLPNPGFATEQDTVFYRLNNVYELVHYAVGDTIYGSPLYDPALTDSTEILYIAQNWYDSAINPKYNPLYDQFINEALIFRHPDVSEDIYLALYDDNLITVATHLGQSFTGDFDTVKDRLARRYYDVYMRDIGRRGIENYLAVTAFDRGMPSKDLLALESGRDADANMVVFFPGPSATNGSSDNVYVVPNPYTGLSAFDGRREMDDKGDKSRRVWFVNLPEECTIRIFTLAGDLVDTIEHNGAYMEDVINPSKAAQFGIAASGTHTWDLLSHNNQIVVSGVYLFSVEDAGGDVKVGKFVIIR
ncbi:MAG: hypothetical protein K8R90_00040 [Candidatus Cloacimonetes bacterium]|nr:hypothetical protein [Candidatus Cloacimonadota bacterium]